MRRMCCAAVRRAVERRQQDLDFIRLDPAGVRRQPVISLDYAVAERTTRAAVVPADLGWSDVGSWGALWELGAEGRAAATSRSATCCSRRRQLLRAQRRHPDRRGRADDAVVVVTEDAVLAMHRDDAQDVKKVVDRLRAAGRHEAVAHNRVLPALGLLREPDPRRPLPGEADRRHARPQAVAAEALPPRRALGRGERHRAGHARRGGVLVRENESIYLPLGCVHRMENPGKIPLTLIEVQSGAYLGEDDIVRLEDTYGRS